LILVVVGTPKKGKGKSEKKEKFEKNKGKENQKGAAKVAGPWRAVKV